MNNESDFKKSIYFNIVIQNILSITNWA